MVNDALLFAAGLGLFLAGLVVMGLIADWYDRRDARRRNQARPWRW